MFQMVCERILFLLNIKNFNFQNRVLVVNLKRFVSFAKEVLYVFTIHTDFEMLVYYIPLFNTNISKKKW